MQVIWYHLWWQYRWWHRGIQVQTQFWREKTPEESTRWIRRSIDPGRESQIGGGMRERIGRNWPHETSDGLRLLRGHAPTEPPIRTGGRVGAARNPGSVCMSRYGPDWAWLKNGTLSETGARGSTMSGKGRAGLSVVLMSFGSVGSACSDCPQTWPRFSKPQILQR